MYGWRGRIGVIVSPPNTVVECEFAQMAPEGVSIHAARLGRPAGAGGQLSGETVLQTNEDLPRAASSLAELRLDVVVFAHTAGSMLGGIQYDQHLIELMVEKAGCPAVTTASAVVAALQKGGTQRLALLTPYPEVMTVKEADFLQKAVPTLTVVSQRSLGTATGLAIGDLAPQVAYQEARNIDTDAADGLFLSGTNWRTIEVIEDMEEDLGMPVLTANQVTMWAALGKLKVTAKPGFGSLFSSRV